MHWKRAGRNLDPCQFQFIWPFRLRYKLKNVLLLKGLQSYEQQIIHAKTFRKFCTIEVFSLIILLQ